MDFFALPSFYKSLKSMKRKRQINDKAVGQVNQLLGSINSGDKNPLSVFKPTKNGETRIKKCVKYDLHSFCRLITIQDGAGTTLLFVGDHEDSDEWLKNNRGLIIGSGSQKLGTTYVGSPEHKGLKNARGDKWAGRLIERLDEKKQEIIFKTLSFSAIKPIQNLDAGSDEEAISASVSVVEDPTLKQAIEDTLILLNRGDVEEAEKRVDFYSGEFKSLGNLSSGEIIEVIENSEIKRIPVGSPEYLSWVDSFINAEQPFDWFLFMHPEQEQFVDNDYSGSAVLSGVSGSGKTAIAVKRAIRLAKKYNESKILVITLNKALADLISEIINYACTDRDITVRIDVKCYFDLAIELIHSLEPENRKLYTSMNDLDEHKDEIFREFYRCMANNLSAEVILPTHYHLAAQKIDAEKYISEEFDWIRSTTTEKTRYSYLEILRKGRGFPLFKNHRRLILEGLEAWEQKMRDVGVIDNLGLTISIGRHLNKIKAKYRSVIVDEAQDFGTSELSILRLLVTSNENDMFFCGDAAQQVQPKCQSFQEAGIEIGRRAFTLSRNYRNSKEILELASSILIENLADEHLEHSELEISDPELALRSSAEPVLLSAISLEQEIAFALELISQSSIDAKKKNKSHTGCVAIAGYSQFEIEQFGKQKDLHVLNGEKKMLGSEVFLSDLEQTKGFEFDTVVIINCREGVLPPTGIPREEMYRFISQFYVAMTRAKEQLILSYSNEKSNWLDNQNVELAEFDWNEYIDEESLQPIGKPGFLPEFPGERELKIPQMSGSQFIYTEAARGLSPDTLSKIVASVPKGSTIEELFAELTKDEANKTKIYFGADAASKFVSGYLEAMDSQKSIMIRDPNFSEVSVTSKQPTTPITTVRARSVMTRFSNVGVEKVQTKLSEIKLTAKEYATLHGLGLRTLDDLISCDSRTLRDHFTARKVNEIKKMAKAKRKSQAQKAGIEVENIVTSIRIADAGFSPRTLKVLQDFNIKTVDEINNIKSEKLRKNPNIGKTQLLEIQRIVKQNGLNFTP